MKFRESQKYKADLLKGFGFLMTVPIGNFALDLIFKQEFKSMEMLISLLVFFVGLYLHFLGYYFMKKEDIKIKKFNKEKN
jgi:uncharacterized membrane protein YcaP (DUF421 family)